MQNIFPVDNQLHQSGSAKLPKPRLIIGDNDVLETSAGVYQHVSSSTGEKIAEIPLAGATEVDMAVKAAREGFNLWSGMRPDERRDKLMKFAFLVEEKQAELAELCALESGSSLQFSQLAMPNILNWMKYYAGWADKVTGDVVATMPSEHFEYIVNEPWGVIATIIPWNAPLLSCAMKVPPALAAGNTVIIKPTEATPYTALRFAELALEAGIPSGVINVVTGGAEAGEALCTHSGVDKISFTGGTPTAQRIMISAAENLTPVMFELGGKSANIIFDDADLEAAIPFSAGFGMVNSGQACALPSRLLIHDAVFDEVLEKVITAIKQLPIGDPLNPNVYLGPLYNQVHMERVLSYIEDAKANCGGTLLMGGKRMEDTLGSGCFVEPTVFLEPNLDSALAQEEAFGPVMAVFRFKTDDEAVEIANSTRWALASYIQTRNLQRAHRMAARLRSGVVHMNGAPNVHYSSTFGGVGMSGFGREGGKQGLMEYLRPKAISTF